MLRQHHINSKGVAFLTSYFYTTLRTNGVHAVRSWRITLSRFNLLKKKYLFVPMNVSGGKHWALAVIVNASAIDNGLKYCKGGHNNASGFDKKKLAPCILYLDSGEVSQSKAVTRCRVLKKWLDYKNTNDGESADLNTNVYTFQKVALTL